MAYETAERSCRNANECSAYRGLSDRGAGTCEVAQAFANRTCESAGSGAMASQAGPNGLAQGITDIIKGAQCLVANRAAINACAPPTTQDYYNALTNENEKSNMKWSLDKSPDEFLNRLQTFRTACNSHPIYEQTGHDRRLDR